MISASLKQLESFNYSQLIHEIMKKIIFFLFLVTIFGISSYAQNMGEIEKTIKKSFFKGEKASCVKNYDLDNVAVYKVNEHYYAVAACLSPIKNFSQEVARTNFYSWLVENFGEVIVTESKNVQKRNASGSVKHVYPVKFTALMLEKETLYLLLYDLQGEITVNDKPVDIEKIIN
jgi:hypothetical protein